MDEIRVCNYCGAPTEERFSGDEGWTFCIEGCGCLEGEKPVYRDICDCSEFVEDCSCMITEDQKVQIRILVWNVDYMGYLKMYKESVKREIDGLTAVEAQKFIWRLETCQMMKNIDAGNGGYGQKEIIEKLNKIQKQ